MGADSDASCATSEDMAALVEAVPQLRALNLHMCATMVHDAGAAWPGTQCPYHTCALDLGAASFDVLCTVRASCRLMPDVQTWEFAAPEAG
jgi:hypothetical protein